VKIGIGLLILILHIGKLAIFLRSIYAIIWLWSILLVHYRVAFISITVWIWLLHKLLLAAILVGVILIRSMIRSICLVNVLLVLILSFWSLFRESFLLIVTVWITMVAFPIIEVRLLNLKFGWRKLPGLLEKFVVVRFFALILLAMRLIMASTIASATFVRLWGISCIASIRMLVHLILIHH